MRIAQVTPVYPPYRGGMARVAFEYTERLRARGHDVHVYTPARSVEQHSPAQPEHVHRLPVTLRVGNAGILPSLRAHLKQFDVAHIHYPFYGGAEATVRGREPDGRHRAVVLTYYMDATADGVKGTLFDLHRKTVQPWILSKADRILVSSREYAEASALAGIDGALSRMDVCPFGVDLVRFRPGHEPELRALLHIDSSDTIILFVGSLDAAHRFKGLGVLIAALVTIRHLPWHLVVVGDGEDRPRFEHTIGMRQVQSRVHFVGDVGDELLPAYYRLADLHVLPSTNGAEAFGLVTLEAAASGLPSIVPDLPGVRTNVVHGTTGLVVPPANALALAAAIEALLKPDGQRESLGCQARLRVERECQWEPLVDQLETIYDEVCNGR